MKLILLTNLLISLATNAQKFRQEQFPFPPQFQTPNAGLYSSDSSLYLPPESHTPIPYFPMKNQNGLQFPLLPPTGTKVPSIYPTPFPFIMSTTLIPNFEEDDDEEDKGRIRLPSPSPMQQRQNQTDRLLSKQSNKENREIRNIPMRVFPQPIQNRNDIKFPFKVPNPGPSMTTSTTPAPSNPTPATRRMIIETHKSDLGLDQLRAASLQGGPFIPAGGGLYVSSTTEPAIPILRLSNEMDLDGSFSYEALGADQTHYVQHSRMENLGPDKQEQVVEGSYSYVGDNGQTYTVHYIADANGFRASGEHLPVAPPVPEIIQRAVQYNLQEEAKKPPHLRDNGSWQDDRRDNEISDNNKAPQFSLPPTRNLFTGRTPEAFSYSFAQGSNTGNNLVTAASNQAPVKTVEYTQTTEQPKPKPNNGPISPQITFLASQGAHVPSMNPVQDAISRMFTTEKSPMPQLMNYEAGIKETDQEPNKGLWRWQYGINANNLSQNPNKDSISRSFGEGDDIMINFGDMTSDQYTKMIRSQFEYTPEQDSINRHSQKSQSNQQMNQNNYIEQFYQNQQPNQQVQYQYQSLPNSEYSAPNQNTIGSNYPTINEDSQPSPSTIASFPQSEEQYNKQIQNFNEYNRDSQILATNKPINFNQYNQENQIQSTIKPINFNQYNKDNQIQSINKPVQLNQYNQDQRTLSNSKPDNYNQDQSSNVKSPVENRKLISDTQKLITHKDFFPTQTVTQSYNFDEDTFYEPRKIKALNNEPVVKISSQNKNSVLDNYDNKQHHLSNIFLENSYTTDHTWDKGEHEYKQSTTPEPYISTVRNIKFSDFILQDSKNDFKPITTTTSTETPRPVETTTENIVEDILQNNIFLKNLFSPEKSEPKNPQQDFEQSQLEVTQFTDTKQYPEKPQLEITQFADTKQYPEKSQEVTQFTDTKQYPEIRQYSQVKRYPEVAETKTYTEAKDFQETKKYSETKTQNEILEEAKKTLHTKVEAEPKTDKVTKLIPFQPKPVTEMKVFKKKPMDIAEIINFVTMKNHFESSKVKTKNNKPTNTYDPRNEVRFIPIQQEREQNEVIQGPKQPTLRPHVENQEELKGVIKNYKVLHRNNNVKYDNNPLKRELSPPPLKSQLPPLGRAGPSMKSYLPPIFV